MSRHTTIAARGLHVTPSAPARSRRTWVLIAAIVIATLSIGLVWTRLVPSFSSPQREAVAAKVEKAERKEKAAAEYAYPVSTGTLPPAITVAFDEAKNRTRMTLTLNDLAASAASGYRIDHVELKMVSEFAGRDRDPEKGELSARCTLSLVSSTPGVLAPSSPPVVFTADGKALHAYAPTASNPGYHSKGKQDGSHESLIFLVPTHDLIRIAKGNVVTAKAGAVALSFSPGQLATVREFVARMNPRP